MALISLIQLLAAGFRRFATKFNLGAHTIFAIVGFIEAQWYLNPAFKSAVLSLYAHTGMWIHALIPMVAAIYINYRDASKKPKEGQPPVQDASPEPQSAS